MEEVIKYFGSLEARIAALEAQIAELEKRVSEQETIRLTLENHLDAMEEHCSMLAEHIATLTGERNELQERLEAIPEIEEPAPTLVAEPEPAPEPEPIAEPILEIPEPEPIAEPAPEPEPELPIEEPVSPKAAIYGKAVDDIRLAISLGDRFLYQRELFGQNAELMQRTLTELNALDSYDEAVNYISTRFQWDTESSTYQQFLVTLHRRFG